MPSDFFFFVSVYAKPFRLEKLHLVSQRPDRLARTAERADVNFRLHGFRDSGATCCVEECQRRLLPSRQLGFFFVGKKVDAFFSPFFFYSLEWTTWLPMGVRLSVSSEIRSWSAGEAGSCALWSRRGQVGGQVFPLIRNDKFSPGPVPGDAGVPGLTGQRRLSWPKGGGGAERATLQFIETSLVCRRSSGLSGFVGRRRFLLSGYNVVEVFYFFSWFYSPWSFLQRHIENLLAGAAARMPDSHKRS